jgi:hypothetical protein
MSETGRMGRSILMFLRRNNKVRSEVSFDEPLNTDWDGNELRKTQAGQTGRNKKSSTTLWKISHRPDG